MSFERTERERAVEASAVYGLTIKLGIFCRGYLFPVPAAFQVGWTEIKENLNSMESTMNKLLQALDSKGKGVQKSGTQILELTGTVPSLRRDVHRPKRRCD